MVRAAVGRGQPHRSLPGERRVDADGGRLPGGGLIGEQVLVGEAVCQLVPPCRQVPESGLEVCDVDEVRCRAVAQFEALADGGAGEVFGEPVGGDAAGGAVLGEIWSF